MLATINDDCLSCISNIIISDLKIGSLWKAWISVSRAFYKQDSIYPQAKVLLANNRETISRMLGRNTNPWVSPYKKFNQFSKSTQYETTHLANITVKDIINNPKFAWNYRQVVANKNITVNDIYLMLKLKIITLQCACYFHTLTVQLVKQCATSPRNINILCLNESITWAIIQELPYVQWNYTDLLYNNAISAHDVMNNQYKFIKKIYGTSITRYICAKDGAWNYPELFCSENYIHFDMNMHLPVEHIHIVTNCQHLINGGNKAVVESLVLKYPNLAYHSLNNVNLSWTFVAEHINLYRNNAMKRPARKSCTKYISSDSSDESDESDESIII
jgi:hypothetical protein